MMFGLGVWVQAIRIFDLGIFGLRVVLEEHCDERILWWLNTHIENLVGNCDRQLLVDVSQARTSVVESPDTDKVSGPLLEHSEPKYPLIGQYRNVAITLSHRNSLGKL